MENIEDTKSWNRNKNCNENVSELTIQDLDFVFTALNISQLKGCKCYKVLFLLIVSYLKKAKK